MHNTQRSLTHFEPGKKPTFTRMMLLQVLRAHEGLYISELMIQGIGSIPGYDFVEKND